MSASSLDLDVIRHPIIKTAIVAMNSRNKKQWYALFSDKLPSQMMEIPMILPYGVKRSFLILLHLPIWPQSTKSMMAG